MFHDVKFWKILQTFHFIHLLFLYTIKFQQSHPPSLHENTHPYKHPHTNTCADMQACMCMHSCAHRQNISFLYKLLNVQVPPPGYAIGGGAVGIPPPQAEIRISPSSLAPPLEILKNNSLLFSRTISFCSPEQYPIVLNQNCPLPNPEAVSYLY